MTIETNSAFIKTVWAGLNKPAPKQHHEKMIASYVAKITASGWAYGPDIEDLPTYMDPRIDPIHDVSYRDLVATFGLPVRYVYDQPKRGDDDVIGFPALCSADFAYLLISLERLGFLMDPKPLVEAIRPDLLKRPHVTEQERQVILYEKQRHRMAPMSLHARPAGAFSDLLEERITTSAGYKACLQSTDLGEPISLIVKAPKYRRANADSFL